MAFNGSGTFSPYTPGNPVVSGTSISSMAFNNTINDLASGLSNAVTRDGQSPPTANLPMGSKKLTGLADGTVAGDSVAFGQSATFSGVTDSGNLTFTGTGNRITGDFSNATLANRVLVKSSTVNGETGLSLVTNGTNIDGSYLLCHGNSDPDNSSSAGFACSQTLGQVRISASYRGTGTYLPMTFYTGGSERMRIDTSGNVLVTGSGGLGYGTGSGGTVTQATSKSTAVTLNKPSGQITMNNAALAATTEIGFQLNNTLISLVDQLLVTTSTSSPNYSQYAFRVFVQAGNAAIYVKNLSAGSLSDAIVINFAIIRGATA